jgi:DNA-binding response OmpR family regulator
MAATSSALADIRLAGEELLARLRALLRRTAGRAADPSADPRLRVDAEAHRVYVGQREVELTGKEFAVLALLAAGRGKVVLRQELMSEVWSEGWYGSTKTLDVTMGRLRQKLAEAAPVDRIVTVRGVGFRLEG